MSDRDNGEFELILGNKQLLSVLFIVIILLGVFFAMGFLAGRSTSTSQVAASRIQQAPPPIVVDTAAKSSPATASEETAARKQDPPASPEPPVSGGSSVPPTETAAPPAPVPSGANPSGFIETPPAGTYLQVAATRKEDGESMLGLLIKAGLKGYITPSPKSPELVRVLVGPFSGGEGMAEAREALKRLGIEKPYPIKY